MGVAGEDGGVIFSGRLLVQFLHENKLNSEIFSLLTKMSLVTFKRWDED